MATFMTYWHQIHTCCSALLLLLLFVLVFTWIFQGFSWICLVCLHGFVILLHGYVKVVDCISQSCDMYVLHKTELKRLLLLFLFFVATSGSLFCFHLFCIILLLSCYIILIFCYLSPFLLSPASHPSHLKAISPVTGQTLYVSVNAFVQSPFYFFLYFIVFLFCVPSFLLHLYFVLTS